jgi:hypothetical protein
LTIKPELLRVGEARHPPTRASVSPSFFFFKSVFAGHLSTRLAEILNKKKVLPLGEEYRREQAKIKSEEVFQFIKHLVGCIAHPAPSLKAFLVSSANQQSSVQNGERRSFIFLNLMRSRWLKNCPENCNSGYKYLDVCHSMKRYLPGNAIIQPSFTFNGSQSHMG